MIVRPWTSLLFVSVAMVTTANGGVFTCCTPKLWMSVVRVIRMSVDQSGSVERQETKQTVNYDANNQRVAVLTFGENEVAPLTRQILDFAKRVRYVITGEEQQKCTRHPLTKPFKSACVPDNTTQVYFARVGDIHPAYSPGLWENTAYFSQNDVTGYITVTMVDCALVAEVVYGDVDFQDSRGHKALTMNIQYLNQTLNTVNPTAFRLPSTCPHVDFELRDEPWQQFSVLGQLI